MTHDQIPYSRSLCEITGPPASACDTAQTASDVHVVLPALAASARTCVLLSPRSKEGERECQPSRIGLSMSPRSALDVRSEQYPRRERDIELMVDALRLEAHASQESAVVLGYSD